MKKSKLLLLMALLFSCNGQGQTSEFVSSSFSEEIVSSEEISSSYSSEEIISSEDISSYYSSEEVISNEEKEKIYYTSHPSSEKDFLEQLQVINHMGDLFNVWNYYRGEGVKVAVIDSGFDYNHPDFFKANGKTIISEESIYISSDNDGNITKKVGIINVGITDGDSHGTMCAGLLASCVNGTGMSGIAPES